MRYANGETVRAAQTFQPGRTVTVTVLKLDTDALETLTSNVATESAQHAGLYVWPSSNLQTQPSVYTEYIVRFTDGTSGLFKDAKIVLRGVVDNLDAAVSSRSTLGIVDVQTALTNQGYSPARALLLDNLDAAITSLNDLSIADIQTAMTNQGYTTGRAPNLDNLDATISSRSTLALGTALTSTDTIDAALSRLDNIDADAASAAAGAALITSLESLVRGGRNIDFVGNDALGWQRVELNAAAVEVARYNLLDEAGARITGTVVDFLSNSKMIAAEVLI